MSLRKTLTRLSFQNRNRTPIKPSPNIRLRKVVEERQVLPGGQNYRKNSKERFRKPYFISKLLVLSSLKGYHFRKLKGICGPSIHMQTLDQCLVPVPIRINAKSLSLKKRYVDPFHKVRRRRGQNPLFKVTGMLACLVLQGCTGTTYPSHFDCPMGEGAGCASISRVNRIIDRQEIDLGDDDRPYAPPNSNNEKFCEGNCPSALKNQVYVYYGPDQLGRLVTTNDTTA